jgi:hypothetical protein
VNRQDLIARARQILLDAGNAGDLKETTSAAARVGD